MTHPNHPDTLRADGQRLARYTAIERQQAADRDHGKIMDLLKRPRQDGARRSLRYARIERGVRA